MTSLQESKTARISPLCALYFAQGFPWGFMTTALVAYLANQGLSVEETGYLISMAVLPYDNVFILVGIFTILPLGLLILINSDIMFKLKKAAKEI